MKIAKLGFTLIELLIVIGILGVLAVAVLAAINPAEAQKKGRDTKRMSDLRTLQTIIEQYIQDGGTLTTGTRDSTMNGASTSCTATGWLAIDVCNYINALPVDPVNKASSSVMGIAAPTGCTTATRLNGLTAHRVQFDAAANTYEVNVRQEAQSNCKPINTDGGNNGSWVEVGSDPGLDLSGA